MNYRKTNYCIKTIIFLIVFSSSLIAQYTIYKSVMANGGFPIGDERIMINSTVGQPVIGISATESDSCKLGFWYVNGKAVVGLDESHELAPNQFRLYQNYPNPFNPITVINYELPITNYVELAIYDVLGRKVSTLISKHQPVGYYSITWDASGFASGVYYYRLVAGEFVDMKKLILLR